MARKIIVLEQVGLPSDASYRAALWLDVPAARQSFYANPAATSAVIGITTSELDAIKAGAVVEEVVTAQRPTGGTLGQLRTLLENEHARAQATLTAQNPYNRYGTFWDGTTWTNGGVA